jgi:AmmeMemoRadiSam system protein B/AmmeMemoRadiSam system protein A
MKLSAFTQYLAVILFVSPVDCQGQPAGHSSSVRRPAVAGLFYPSNPDTLRLQLTNLFRSFGNSGGMKNSVALIVPHAGYIFSGEVAASAYACLDPDKIYDRIFLIGPSHHTWLTGASIYNKGNYSTPLGIVPVDTALASRLINDHRFFEYRPEAHTKEHSIEVQLPFLQYRLKHEFKIIPIVIGTQSPVVCRKIAEALRPYFNEKNLFIISSDFSHYPDYAGALKADQVTGDAIGSNSVGNFLKTIRENESKQIPGLVTSACGQNSILTLLNLSSEMPGIKVHPIKYMNSGDSEYGDKLRVVGYHSFVFTRDPDTHAFSLSDEEKAQLLEIARGAIEYRLQNKGFSVVDTSAYSKQLKAPLGAFVTLHKNGRLRGCIGQFLTTRPLYDLVQKMAVAAAFQDFRFDPVGKDEMNVIDVEISVLTPLKRIASIDEFELGKQGIYMIKGNRSGTFLPQVAMNTGWNKNEFLGHCAHDKAGIGWDGWKDAELYTYEALVFGEKDLQKAEQ